MSVPLYSPAPATVLHALHGETMGTNWSIRLVASPRADLHALHALIQAELDRVVAEMSTWEADSDISRFNHAAAGDWQDLPEGFFTVLRCALAIAEASGGAFDPTIGSAVGLWGFGAQAGTRKVPTEEARTAIQAGVGWQRLSLDTSHRRLRQPGGVQLDLSAIAKGYAVDAVSAALRASGISAALIEVGGELHGYGRKPDGEHWRVLIESSPEEEEAAGLEPRIAILDNLAVATSGDRWHWYEQDGERYTHTIDPRTGHPVSHANAAVTVLAASAMEADAWATALTVLGADAGLRLAERTGLAARFVIRAGGTLEERASRHFATHLAP
nr:FAD:protein FMN transferase [Pseudoxanthomonas sp.]